MKEIEKKDHLKEEGFQNPIPPQSRILIDSYKNEENSCEESSDEDSDTFDNCFEMPIQNDTSPKDSSEEKDSD